VERVNQSVAKLLVEDMYFTAFFGRVDPTGTRLEYVNAGHPPALILRAGGAGVDLLDNTGFPVGIMEEAAFDMAETSLHAGDRVVLYTDGVTEALNQNLDLFGMKRFQDSLAARAQASLDVMADGVIEDLIAYCGGDVFNDDVNLLICEVVGP
jgi:sigma-B regulation protein RsbU (phosphoserine phosphatase)